MLLQHFRENNNNNVMKLKPVTGKKSVLTEQIFVDSNKTDVLWGKQRLNFL